MDPMSTPHAPLCLTMGDPAGCGPSITMAAWKALQGESDQSFYVRGAPALYDGVPTTRISDPGEAAGAFARALPVMALECETGPVETGHPNPKSARATLESIRQCVGDVTAGRASGLVTNPISKSLLSRAGFGHPGHTEFLAELCQGEGRAAEPVMMLVGGGLRVALATIHMPLVQAIRSIKGDRLQTVARIVDRALRSDFGLTQPRIVFTGLNPHAGEDGLLGEEEIEIINPAAADLRAEGIQVEDARPADTVFAEALSGRFDAVIAMTHDQGLIPVKTLDMWGGVNTTLGLPIIRTSPDHGTAYDAARLGTARADSLVAAIRLATEMAVHRAGAHHG